MTHELMGFGSVLLPSPDSFFCHKHTLVKLVADRFESFTDDATDIQKATLIITTCSRVFFLFFFCPTISKRSKAKMIHTQREKKTGKNKEIQLSVPCCDPPQMERKTDTRYKNITIFIYQTACGGFVQKSEEDFYLLPFFFDYFLQFQLSDAHQRALHQLLFFFHFLFHITKLHFYSHIFKFKFLF